MIRRFLLACTAAALAVAVLLAVSGGVRFTVGGLRISTRSLLTPSLLALVTAGGWLWLAARSGRAAQDLIDVWASLNRYAWPIVIGVAAASAGIGIAFGTYSAAGADASGYLSQAAMWVAGRLGWFDALSRLSGWPMDAGITVPLGWSPALDRPWQVPTYAPGLSLLMAIPYAVGGSLIASLIVPAAAAIAVVAVGAMAYEMAGVIAAIFAAVLLATCPVFIFQSTQPMSDVPVAAAWMVCWAGLITADGRRQTADVRAFSAGIACAVAVLIRPNLAPLAIVPLLYLLRPLRTPAPSHSRTAAPPHLRTLALPHFRTSAPLLFALPVVVAGVFLGWLQWRWYGSPFRSGYGAAEQLFGMANVAPNAWRYVMWLVSTSPVLVLALAGVWIRWSRATLALVAFAAMNAAAYLVYFVFDEWFYLRFLLPALGVAAVFAGVAVAAMVNRLVLPARAAVLVAALLAIGGVGLWRARTLDVFRLADAHRRVLQIDGYLEAALPSRAVMIAGEQSGAARHDTGHEIVRWEATSRADLLTVLGALHADGRAVWILLDAWEEPLVRAKYDGVDAVALDWPPAVDAGDIRRTRAWRLADRERYLKGERMVTDRLR